MGCLQSILRKIIFIALVVAFFALGGYTFTKQQINKYQNPTREEFIQSEQNYGDFSSVPSDYQLTRSFNFFGYKKINAKYLPTAQKIMIVDLKSEEKLSPNDFKTDKIDIKIEELLNKTKDSLITLEDFKITQRGVYQAKGKQIPYVNFSAKVKNIPFSNKTGTIAAYSTINKKAKNSSTKLIVTMTDAKAFNPNIIKGFIQAVRF